LEILNVVENKAMQCLESEQCLEKCFIFDPARLALASGELKLSKEMPPFDSVTIGEPML